MGNFDRAVADYDRAISIKSDFTAAYYNRGLVLADKKQYAKAISDFTTVLQVDPKNAMALYRRGTAYLNSGDAKNGNADLAEARAISPNIAADVNRAEP
jgi:tetratricopeptide (TPR) repeat protein